MTEDAPKVSVDKVISQNAKISTEDASVSQGSVEAPTDLSTSNGETVSSDGNLAGAPRFIKSDLVAKLQAGSYEEKMYQVLSAVEKNKQLFSPEGKNDVEITVLATFHDKAFVTTSDARLYRVMLEDESSGVRIVKVDDVPIMSMSKEEATNYRDEMALSVVDNFIVSRVLGDIGPVVSATKCLNHGSGKD